MIEKIFKSLGLINIKDYNILRQTAVEIGDKLIDTSHKLESSEIENKQLNNQIKSLSSENKKLNEAACNWKKTAAQHLQDKQRYHALANELEKNIDNLELEKDALSHSVKVMQGKLGGCAATITKIKNQYRFALAIFFKDVKRDMESDIFLGKEYDRLKKWDEERKQKL